MYENTSIGALWLQQPEWGYWQLADHPDWFVYDGGVFLLQDFWQISQPGIVAQYREDVPVNSRHLKVRTDGIWYIDHYDEHNPQRGSALLHFFADYLPEFFSDR